MIPDPGARRVAAFLVVGLFLVIASDYESTASLAVAFAYLILLSALFAAGPVAFGRLTAAVSTRSNQSVDVTSTGRVIYTNPDGSRVGGGSW